MKRITVQDVRDLNPCDSVYAGMIQELFDSVGCHDSIDADDVLRMDMEGPHKLWLMIEAWLPDQKEKLRALFLERLPDGELRNEFSAAPEQFRVHSVIDAVVLVCRHEGRDPQPDIDSMLTEVRGRIQ